MTNGIVHLLDNLLNVNFTIWEAMSDIPALKYVNVRVYMKLSASCDIMCYKDVHAVHGYTQTMKPVHIFI